MSGPTWSMGAILFPLLVLAVLGMIAFWIWMLVDCVKRESSEGSTRLWWSVAIAVTHVLGATAYFLFRKLPRAG